MRTELLRNLMWLALVKSSKTWSISRIPTSMCFKARDSIGTVQQEILQELLPSKTMEVQVFRLQPLTTKKTWWVMLVPKKDPRPSSVSWLARIQLVTTLSQLIHSKLIIRLSNSGLLRFINPEKWTIHFKDKSLWKIWRSNKNIRRAPRVSLALPPVWRTFGIPSTRRIGWNQRAQSWLCND